MITKLFFIIILAAAMVVSNTWNICAMDSEITRRTLANLPGFYIAFEEIQPNLRQYAIEAGMPREQLLKDVEIQLQKAGIRVLLQGEWIKTQGRPVLYVNVNTHVESTNVAYGIRVEARQIVFTDASPPLKTLAGTWGVDMTGLTKVEKLDVIRHDILVLLEKFIEAYWAVNRK